MNNPSFTAVNYSLRPSKTIQRAIVFEDLRRLQDVLEWGDPLYLGFGSIWFTDFTLAHKVLRIRKMISIEANEIGFSRAKFNKPYRFVEVAEGFSYDVVPKLLKESALTDRPWIIWLDYDGAIDEDKIAELQLLTESAPPNSVLLATFDASEKKYGIKPSDKIERIRQLFGDLVPDDYSSMKLRESSVSSLLGELMLKKLMSVAFSSGRVGGGVPAFRMAYKDKASMVTVGVVLPDEGRSKAVRKCVKSKMWQGFPKESIIAPHLTPKEVSVLQSQLPRSSKMTRASIRRIGFDLEEEQIRVFEEYYRHYPTFMQISS